MKFVKNNQKLKFPIFNNMPAFRRFKAPLTFAFLGCFIIIAFLLNRQVTGINNSAKNAMNMNGASFVPTVILDAGHGGLDAGCVGVHGELEKDINLAIVKDLAELLRFTGYTVITTRDEDMSIHDKNVTGARNQKVSDMENRKAIIEKYPDSIFVSIHQNQFTQPQFFGAQMFYTNKNKGNIDLAQIMQNSFAILQPDNDREIKLIDNNLYLFKDTVQPAILIECGFLSNPNDADNLNNSDYQKKVAVTIFRGLTEYLKQENQNNM